MMQFFVLNVQVGSPHETRFSKMDPVQRGEGNDRQACPVCGEHIGLLPWFPPYRAELMAYGKAPGDVAFGPGNGLLVSARFRTAWEEKNLRGLDFATVERTRVRPARLGKKTVSYFYVEPRRFGTRVDLSRSLIEYDEPFACMTCLHSGPDSVRGFAIDEASWTGEDMFYAWGMPGSIIVTDRGRQLRDAYGLTNVNLTRTEEYFWDPYYRWSVIDYSRDDIAAPEESPEPSHSN